MAVNQAQVDHIISSASADDPEVKLLKLQDEVDLIKTSVKRLLIDIRERMNELDNPFAGAAHELAAGAREQAGSRSGSAAHEPTHTVPAAEKAPPQEPATTGVAPPLPPTGARAVPGAAAPHEGDDLLLALRSQLISPPRDVPTPTKAGQEKLRLQKVHRLFEWTSKTVKKYGHDRLELMLESYRAMGYITKDSFDQVKEISRLMPSSIGDSHEIGPDEFVSELYSLNRILDPGDTTLDRDMIEVLMEQKRGSTAPAGKRSVKDDIESEWAPMQDRI
jgi:hypothetical protein